MSNTKQPSEVLLQIIATFLTPLFLGGPSGNNDPAVARQAAIEVLNTFRFQNAFELAVCAQIIGFTFASLGGIALSMADDLSNSMILRLRGNANACTRSANSCHRTLAACRTQTEQAELRQAEQARDAAFDAKFPDEALLANVAETQRMAAEASQRLHGRAEFADAMQEMMAAADKRFADEIEQTAKTGMAPEPPAPYQHMPAQSITVEEYLNAPITPRLIGGHDPAASSPPKPAPEPAQPANPSRQPTPTADDERRTVWANAMGQVAAEFAAELAHAPPEERRLNKIRANALSSVARTLLSNNSPAGLSPFKLPLTKLKT